MPAPRYFFDTYAMFERLRGSPAYEPYRDAPILTHQMNVYELVTALLREQSETRTRHLLTLLAPNHLDAETDDLFAAADFRAEHAKRRISHVDALGYVLARRYGLLFLTGDKAFKGIEGVAFVA